MSEKLEPVAYAAFADNGNIRIWSQEPGRVERAAVVDDFKVEPLVTLSSATSALEAKDARIAEYWTTPNDKPCKFCGGEPEGPDKCTGADTRIMTEAADEIERLRKLDAEYGRVETAVIMADPEFDGDSDHKDCGDRLIASVTRMKDEIERLRTELSTAYRRGREDMREEAAKVADAYVANPMKPASGWNDQEAVAYRAGQIDVAVSIETLIRKLEA